VNPVGAREPGDIERAITAFARTSNRGLIVTGSALAAVHHNLIITLAARHQLPAVYFGRFFVTAGGLISYGPDFLDQYRRAAGYVGRILKGENPSGRNTSWRSISRLPGCSASTCRRRCSPAPTR
jgi:ABC-type uncharacterized transport system substrate-binding protein